MCLMAILYKTAKNTPLLVAANREEFYDRPSQAPRIQSGTPRVVCGIDQQAGGTWLGVNQWGLFAAVSNRPKDRVPIQPTSRGLLCRELLTMRTAKEAAELAADKLSTGAYAGANYICGDENWAGVVHGGNQIEIVEMEPGLHVISNGDLDDPKDQRHAFIHRMLTLHTLDSAVTFLAAASRAFSRKADAEGRRGVVLAKEDWGTVSSTLLSLPDRIQQAGFQYAPGPPSDKSFDDLSALLRQVLSAGRSKSNGKSGERDKKRPAKKK